MTFKEYLKEDYVESMDLDDTFDELKKAWLDWRKGPMTEKSDIKPAKEELIDFVSFWIKKNIG